MRQLAYLRRKRLRRLARTHRRPRVFPILLVATLVLFTLLVGALGAAAGVGVGIYNRYSADLVSVDEIVGKQNLGSSQIYDRNGTLLYEFVDPQEGLRNPVTLDKIAPALIQATIATEDGSFYDNPGFNIRGIMRAGLENLTGGGDLSQGTGGSSITQQLVKNVLIPPEERTE